jgi:hypothetical protein
MTKTNLHSGDRIMLIKEARYWGEEGLGVVPEGIFGTITFPVSAEEVHPPPPPSVALTTIQSLQPRKFTQ